MTDGSEQTVLKAEDATFSFCYGKQDQKVDGENVRETPEAKFELETNGDVKTKIEILENTVR